MYLVSTAFVDHAHVLEQEERVFDDGLPLGQVRQGLGAGDVS